MSQSDKRVAIITGAAGGVGQSTVKKFAENGYVVIGTDIRLPDGLFEHDCVSYRTCDVTSETDWQALAEATVSEHGKLDVLVNNAAILMTYTIETSSTEDYKRMMEVNSTSVFLGMKFLLDALKCRLDRVVHGHGAHDLSVSRSFMRKFVVRILCVWLSAYFNLIVFCMGLHVNLLSHSTDDTVI